MILRRTLVSVHNIEERDTDVVYYVILKLGSENCLFKMVLEQAHQIKWEYRKKDNLDSSDDGSDSTSSAEPVIKKLKQISDLMSSKSRKASSVSNSRSLVRTGTRKGNNTQIMKSKKEGSGSYRRTKKISLHGDCVPDGRGTYEPATMNSNLLYMHSILEELRVARENMIEWMRGEVQKLMADPIPYTIAEEDPREREPSISKFERHTGDVPMSNMCIPIFFRQNHQEEARNAFERHNS